MTEYVLQRADDGTWLLTYDPDWLPTPTPDPIVQTGLATWTTFPEDAMRFPSFMAAMDYWKQPSTILPYRLDGRPNRPLTAVSVLVEPAPA